MSHRSGKSLYLDLSKLPRVDGRFKLGRLISRGPTARVYEAFNKQVEKTVVVKVLDNLTDSLREHEEEYRVLKDLSRHRNLPEFLGAYVQHDPDVKQDQLWFVMELCDGGSLEELVLQMDKNERRLPEKVVGYILRELVSVVKYLHMNHIVHRDIRASNILLTSDGHIKLTDFGLARHMKHTMSKRHTSLGSPHWMAPEVIAGQNRPPSDEIVLVDSDGPNEEGEPLMADESGYDNRCDIWSIGITAFELAEGRPPLWDIHPVRVLFQIVFYPPPELKKPLAWSPEFRDFLTECLVKKPEHRPVIMELSQHPFIQEIPEDCQQLRDQLSDLIKRYTSIVPTMNLLDCIVRNGYVKCVDDVKFKKIYPDDLATLDPSMVTEERIMNVLDQRFRRGSFHTFVGGMLLIINPNRKESIYSLEHHKRYKGKLIGSEDPHIFAVAERAWQDMLHHHQHQNIILSGDRHSGKTFNANQIVQHLCYIARGNALLTEKVEQLPFLLDAIGNAATDGNANSSRHVRYLEFTFTSTGKISGAFIMNYMLEKGRISKSLSKSNRNFHIFYYLYYGLRHKDLLAEYQLDNISEPWRYLPVGESEEETEFYLGGYWQLESHLSTWNLQPDRIKFFYRTLAAILLLGQIDFEDVEGGCRVSDDHLLARVSSLLGVQLQALSRALTHVSRVYGEGAEVQPLNAAQADLARHALARGLYSRLADWFVNMLNVQLTFARLVFGEEFTMGVLDPPGFDVSTRRNTFDHLLTNIVNEQLLYHYNQNVFAWEIEDCRAEGLLLEEVKFEDNRELLNAVLAKPRGLLASFDELSKMFSQEDEDGNEINLATIFTSNSHSNQVWVDEDGTLTVGHGGGSVKYPTVDFGFRNSERISDDLVQVMRSSDDVNLVALFSSHMTKTGHLVAEGKLAGRGSKRFNTSSKAAYTQGSPNATVAFHVRHSLIDLLQRLVRGNPHFVRCLRRHERPPTTDQPPVDRNHLALQIRAFSLLPAVKMCQSGFPCRVPIKEFLRRYQFLAFDFDEKVDVTMENCRLLLLRLKMDGWRLGKTKILLKYYAHEYLIRLYRNQLRRIVKIQSVMRSVVALRRIRSKTASRLRSKPTPTEADRAAITIQKNYRGYAVRRESRKCVDFSGTNGPQRAACAIQFFWRKWKKRTLFQQLMLYRADHYQQLVYFCQQVHLYNQEYNGSLRNTAPPVVRVNREERRSLNDSVTNVISLKIRRVPLLLRSRHFVDTAFMCVSEEPTSPTTVVTDPPTRSTVSTSLKTTSKTTPKPIPKTPPKTSPKLPPKNIGTSKSIPSLILSPPSESGTPNGSLKNPAPRPPVITSSNSTPIVSVKDKVGELNGRRDPKPVSKLQPKLLEKDIKRQAPKPIYVNPNPNHQEIVKEIEARVNEIEDPDNAGTHFNFQAMLRKTNYKRNSMKRHSAPDSSVVFDSKLMSSHFPNQGLANTTKASQSLIFEGDAVDL